jgi:DNA invertase Pin-like site-specific DNA recombinase
MKKYLGYNRCSTPQQNLDRGTKRIEDYFENNLPEVDYEIFEDKQTGKNFNRPQYQKLKEKIKPGDELVITEVDRLGRNKEATLKELRYFKEIGVRVKILEIPTTLVDVSGMNNSLASMMTETINNLLIEVYATLAEAEMEKRATRQREGIEQMKARGDWDKYGRPQKISDKDFSRIFENVRAGVITTQDAMRYLNISKSTYYNMRKKYIEAQEKAASI